MAVALRPAPPARRPAPDLARLSPFETYQLDRLLRGKPPTFRAWNERVRPAMRWDWPHLVLLQHHLDLILAGEVRRLVVEIPVRHGKTETGTIGFGAYVLDDDPRRRLIQASYNTTLAAKFSRRTRRVAMTAGVALSDERNAAEDWETAAGGGVRAVGVGAGVAGHGGDGILVDDPVRSREDAESPVFRDKVWDWFTSDLLTRLEPGGFVVVTMSRWHDDDLVGRILSGEDAASWTVLRLPALCEDADADPLGRAVGDALCPERFDEDALAEIRLAVGEYAFASLYQQRPAPRHAGMFPRDRVTIVDAVPANARRLRWWDFGATAGGGDPTAGVRVSVAGGLVYVEDVTSRQLAAAERDKLIKLTAETDGRTVPQWGEQEPGSGGKAQAAAFVRLLAGWPVFTEPTTGDKATAMDPLAAQWQAGNVRLVRGPWNRAFLDEAEAAPFGRHDDAIEAASRAYSKLAVPESRRPFVPQSRTYQTL